MGAAERDFSRRLQEISPIPSGLPSLKKSWSRSVTVFFSSKKKYRRDGAVPGQCAGEVFFLLSSEISCIYKKNGRTRKIHCLIFMPDLTRVAKFNIALSRIGNIASDGRPILGLDAKGASQDYVWISRLTPCLCPAHAWTPHFSIFGAASGFDTMEECFEDLTPHIHAVETGLSSDPSMNWRLSALDGLTLISNSDAHSPCKDGEGSKPFRDGDLLRSDNRRHKDG